MQAANIIATLTHAPGGYIYPNEIEIHWGLLIVIYPYVTGLVAGAFILASLVKVFNVKELQPVYRMALLTALAFTGCSKGESNPAETLPDQSSSQQSRNPDTGEPATCPVRGPQVSPEWSGAEPWEQESLHLKPCLGDTRLV